MSNYIIQGLRERAHALARQAANRLIPVEESARLLAIAYRALYRAHELAGEVEQARKALHIASRCACVADMRGV